MDYWDLLGILFDRFSPRTIYNSSLPKKALVKDIICNGRWNWLDANSVYLLELKNFNLPNLLGSEDFYRWLPYTNGFFSIQSAWEAFRERKEIVPWHNLLWFKKQFPRHSLIAWLAIKRKFMTKD